MLLKQIRIKTVMSLHELTTTITIPKITSIFSLKFMKQSHLKINNNFLRILYQLSNHLCIMITTRKLTSARLMREIYLLPMLMMILKNVCILEKVSSEETLAT